MSVTINMSFEEAKTFFQTAQMPATEKVTLSFDGDDMEMIKQLYQQKALRAIGSFAGSGDGGNVELLLNERQQDRKMDG